MDKNIQNQIDDLQRQINLLKQSSTIPFETQRAFQGRGFLTTPTAFLTGTATIGVGGSIVVPVPGVSVNAIAYATYADGTGSDIGSVLINGVSGTELYLDGTGLKDVYYIIFITTNKTNQ